MNNEQMAARHIIYIINPISGTRSKKNLRDLVEKKTRAVGIPYDVFPSVASGDYIFLKEYILEKKVTDVVIAGGDGTVSQVVGSLMDTKVNFGIIPCGSGNGLAYAAGIPKKAELALEVVFNGKALSTDGFDINGRFACMLSGLGFDAKVAHDFAQQPSRGLATYVRQVLKNFLTARTYPFEIRLKKHRIETDAYFISVANSNQFGNNFTIAPAASLSDGLIDIVIMTHQNKLNLVFETFMQVMGRHKPQSQSAIRKDKSVIYFQTDSLQIINTGQAPLHIDGDPAETPDELEIKVKKKCFRLLQPVV